MIRLLINLQIYLIRQINNRQKKNHKTLRSIHIQQKKHPLKTIIHIPHKNPMAMDLFTNQLQVQESTSRTHQLEHVDVIEKVVR